MGKPQDLDRFAPYSVRHDVARLVHDEFAAAGRSTRTSERRLLHEHHNGAKDTFDREARRGRIVGREVGGLIVEVAQRLAQPSVLVVSCLAHQSV